MGESSNSESRTRLLESRCQKTNLPASSRSRHQCVLTSPIKGRSLLPKELTLQCTTLSSERSYCCCQKVQKLLMVLFSYSTYCRKSKQKILYIIEHDTLCWSAFPFNTHQPCINQMMMEKTTFENQNNSSLNDFFQTDISQCSKINTSFSQKVIFEFS